MNKPCPRTCMSAGRAAGCLHKLPTWRLHSRKKSHDKDGVADGYGNEFVDVGHGIARDHLASIPLNDHLSFHSVFPCKCALHMCKCVQCIDPLRTIERSSRRYICLQTDSSGKALALEALQPCSYPRNKRLANRPSWSTTIRCAFAMPGGSSTSPCWSANAPVFSSSKRRWHR